MGAAVVGNTRMEGVLRGQEGAGISCPDGVHSQVDESVRKRSLRYGGQKYV